MARFLPVTAIVETPISVRDDLRVRALERLYRRREAVDELIHHLELYQDMGQRRSAPCIPINAGRGWSSIR